MSERGQASGKITGYYEPVLHGDTRNTSTARFPIYGIPSDFVSIPLPANLRNSKATVRVSPTGNNRGVIQSNGAYIANLAQFPITARTTALKGRFCWQPICAVFHPRPNQRPGALNGRAPILGYANDPVELFFMHIQGSGRLRTPAGNFCAPRLCRQKRIPLCFHRAIYVHPRLFAAGANLHAKHQIIGWAKPQPPRRSARAKPQLCVF